MTKRTVTREHPVAKLFPVFENDSKYKTAIHEAGHAVVARALGIPVGEVSIKETPGKSCGHSNFDDPRFSWERGSGPKAKAANNFAVALYAGAEAERHIALSDEVGDGPDCERATACLAWAGAVRGATFVGDDVFDRHEARLRRRAVEFVRLHRSAIEAVAALLLQKRTLAGDEIDAVLGTPLD